jgi:hypothetical protein
MEELRWRPRTFPRMILASLEAKPQSA